MLREVVLNTVLTVEVGIGVKFLQKESVEVVVGPQLGGRVVRGEEIADVPSGYSHIVVIRAGLGGRGGGLGSWVAFYISGA